jgi:hypothetical protein
MDEECIVRIGGGMKSETDLNFLFMDLLGASSHGRVYKQPAISDLKPREKRYLHRELDLHGGLPAYKTFFPAWFSVWFIAFSKRGAKYVYAPPER